MSYQAYHRRWRSLKDSDIDGIFYGSPTWDEITAHWNGFADPMTDSTVSSGIGLEIPDFAQRWVELEDSWIVGFDWSAHCERTGQADASTFTAGTGYSIPPTRTPWASWWRPAEAFYYSYWWEDYVSHGGPGGEGCFWTEHQSLISGCIGGTIPIPDVCKENPQ